MTVEREDLTRWLTEHPPAEHEDELEAYAIAEMPRLTHYEYRNIVDTVDALREARDIIEALSTQEW